MNKTDESRIIDEFLASNIEDLLDLNKCSALHERLLQQKEAIISELNIGEEKSPLYKAVENSDNIVKKIDNLKDEADVTLNEICVYLQESQEAKTTLNNKTDALLCHQTATQYFKVVQYIDFLSKNLEAEYSRKKDDEQCATLYANLCEISRNLVDSNAKNLKNYLKDVLEYWHETLKIKFTKDMEEVLKQLKWPFINTNISLQAPPAGSVQKLQLVTEYLLQIELPAEILCRRAAIPTSKIDTCFSRISLPVTVMIEPFKKRFLYHFYGARQTNRTDKPEWYFTQIIKWITDHVALIEEWIQPVVDRMGLIDIDVRQELMSGLVRLAAEKLQIELPNAQYDDYTFSHSVDEALAFDKELKETLNYPKESPGVLNVLTQAKILLKWMIMEKKYATEKMDAIFAEPNHPFEVLPYNISEGHKVSQCADAFVVLLNTITERYECLPQPGHRLQFLDLQLDLLDDFRVRILQLVDTVIVPSDLLETHLPAILNTVYYIEQVLIDWGVNIHFLNLYHYKFKSEDPSSHRKSPADDSNEPENDSVFAPTLALYRRIRTKLASKFTDSITHEVHALFRPYRHEFWSQMKKTPAVAGGSALTLTASASDALEALAKHLHQLEKKLTYCLFSKIWREVALRIDAYLFDDLVLDSRFSEGGANQFRYDISRNLLPLFSQFGEKPDDYFTKLIESCVLLNLAKGSALLLRETLQALEGATGVEDTRGVTLREMGVRKLTPKMAVRVLNQRTDITVNRLVVD